MKHTLICFVFLTALQDGVTGLFTGKTRTVEGVEGGNITVTCSFYFSGEKKLFCKKKCEDGNILVETSADAAQNGRYSIKYEKTGITSLNIMNVSITQLNKSDSGRYSCSLDRLWKLDSIDDFELRVTEASTTSTPNVMPTPPSASEPPPTPSVSSGSGSSTPPSASEPPSAPTPASASTGSSGLLLYVGLILLVMISVFLAALLIFNKKKKKRPTKPRGPPVEAECADREDSRFYEEIGERGPPSRSPPVGVSSVYATVNGPQPGGGEGMSLYSIVTSPQNRVDDNSDHLCYSEVDFSHIPATCSAPCGDATDVVYAVPQVGLSAATHTREAPPPLYSTITSV